MRRHTIAVTWRHEQSASAWEDINAGMVDWLRPEEIFQLPEDGTVTVLTSKEGQLTVQITHEEPHSVMSVSTFTQALENGFYDGRSGDSDLITSIAITTVEAA